MMIELNPKSRPVKHNPCRLNHRVKEKVKKDIDRMLPVGMIFPLNKAEWINHIMIQTKKGMDDIRVCLHCRILNIACVHDPFPNPFSDEVLDQVAGNEAYYFTDGFSGYPHV
jgi:hypothetical protein